ncbi:MAG: hypothetical protein A3F72_02910 [Bacteroidetes bacterium RIFCSPLOWO2_12_FULL_35_15]|nr:MAG: hypothetical protein A3F72_02910 [Bacteroidetes bacterium RIFCSPLOWO2_12_FULL_35_15]
MNEREEIVYRNEDKTFRLTVKNALGAPLDFSIGYNNIVIVIYNQDNSVFQKYSRTVSAGWKSIDVTDQATGILIIAIDSTDTKTGSLSKKNIEVLVRKTDAGVTDDSKYDSITKKYLFTLKDSITSTLTLP